MSLTAPPPPTPPREEDEEPGLSPDAIEHWEKLHSSARDRGGFLGDDWGTDEYVDRVLARFCLPHASPSGLALEIGPGGGRYTERVLPHVRELHAVDLSEAILSK